MLVERLSFDFSSGISSGISILILCSESGHYIENTSETEKLVWIEIYKSDRVADISLAQWLALTPADIVANTLKVDISGVPTDGEFTSIEKSVQTLIANIWTSCKRPVVSVAGL